jgi:hypothetical protein
MSEWKDCRLEFPSSDGFYQICDSIDTQHFLGGLVGYAFYDGYGFKNNDYYLGMPRMWRECEIPEKRYGKLEK